MVYIIMGVSGSGKTTVGQLLAEKLQLPFYDGDDFHAEENIAKMNSGEALTDEDREEWLKTLALKIVQWQADGGAVLACSALKEKYRTHLRSIPPDQLEWILLKGTEEMISQRIMDRKNHFMSASLLHSQFEILEEPAYGIKITVDKSPKAMVCEILQQIRQ